MLIDILLGEFPLSLIQMQTFKTKQMNRFLAILTILFISFSCSIQSKLSRDYKGENIEVVKNHFSTLPFSQTPLDDGTTKFVFTKEERVASTPISQGDATLDPIQSHSAFKTEHYIFIVDKNNTVIRTEYDKDYKRL